MLVLGVSDLEHDTAAALVGDAGLVAAVEEGKLSRSAANSGIPRLAISQCLSDTRAEASDLSAVGVASRPKRAWLREGGLRLRALAGRARLPRCRPQAGGLWKLHQFRLLEWPSAPRVPVLSFEHHLCHAASAFYPSQFDRALVVTLDESGDLWSGMIALGEGADLRILRPMRFPNSLGWFYSRVTELLGFRPGHDEPKVQWLSKEGTAEFVPVFRKLFSRDPQGLPVLDTRCCANGHGGWSTFSPEFCGGLGLSNSSPPRDSALGAAIARSAQQFLEDVVVDLVEAYRKRTGAKNLCVAGGVFLNVLLVRALENRTGFDRVFVQPVSGNPGSALGAAYLARKHLGATSVREPLTHLYWGPAFEEGQIKAVLDGCKTIYRYLPVEGQLIDETVKLLQSDKIVAWYQGRLEFGHRALGNRSILASPFSPYVVENLNRYVKHRESFHPFALSVPAEHAPAFFDCSDNCRFMASIGTLRAAGKDLSGFAFNDQAVRVQTVDGRTNPRFAALLHRFGEGARAPVLVNTSFNLFGEPLVCDPREAVRSFYCSGIDALVLGNFVVVKP